MIIFIQTASFSKDTEITKRLTVCRAALYNNDIVDIDDDADDSGSCCAKS